MKLQINLHNLKMLLIAVIISVVAIGPVAAQGTDEALPTEAAVTEVIVTDEAEATADVTAVPVPDTDGDGEIEPAELQTWQEYLLDVATETAIRAITAVQNKSLVDVIPWLIGGVVLAGVIYALYKSAPAETQLSYVNAVRGRLAQIEEVALDWQEQSNETETPYDNIGSSGLIAILNGVEDILKRQAELLKAQEKMQAQMAAAAPTMPLSWVAHETPEDDQPAG